MELHLVLMVERQFALQNRLINGFSVIIRARYSLIPFNQAVPL